LNIHRYLLIVLILVIKSHDVEAINEHAEVNIVVESLPKNTPANDSIFVCGNFNDWTVNDPRYLLHRQFDGNLAVKVPLIDTLEFKFSRGDWMNIETDKGNVYLPNRVYYIGGPSTIRVQIHNWQDFGGQKSTSVFIFILSAAIFNCMLLIFFVLRIKHRDSRKTFALIVWTSLCMILFTGTILYGLADFIGKFRLFLAFHLSLLWAGPALYHLYNSLIVSKQIRYHVIVPVILSIFIFLRWLNLWHPSWIEAQMTNYLLVIDFIIGIMSPLCFGVYLIVLLYRLSFEKKANQPMTEGFKYRAVLNGTFQTGLKVKPIETTPERKLFLIVLIVNLLAVSAGLLLLILTSVSKKNIIGDYYNMILGLASSQIFILFYFSYVQQSILIASKSAGSSLNPELLYDSLADEIMQFMETAKPYTDPDLSLTQFSEMIHSKPYMVSKVLNDYYQRSFRDFINEYRVRDFIQMVRDKKYKNQTFLNLAYEVGFNSKSTFNLAFKKVTGLSPRDFFKQRTIS
jgi:AraC-like DNA-binding protein